MLLLQQHYEVNIPTYTTFLQHYSYSAEKIATAISHELTSL